MLLLVEVIIRGPQIVFFHRAPVGYIAFFSSAPVGYIAPCGLVLLGLLSVLPLLNGAHFSCAFLSWILPAYVCQLLKWAEEVIARLLVANLAYVSFVFDGVHFWAMQYKTNKQTNK